MKTEDGAQTTEDGGRRLVRTSIALPGPLLAWIDAEADAHGMTRNSFLTLLLELHRRAPLVSAVHGLERRVSALEEAAR